jgi:hypothetical protein
MRPARSIGAHPRSAPTAKSVRAVIGCDHEEGVFSGAFVTSRVAAIDLVRVFRDRLRSGCTILAAQGPLGAFGCLARSIGVEFRDARADGRASDRAHRDVAIAAGNGRRFRLWLSRFCGVATKYMPNYLGWHRLLERRRPPPPVIVALGWLATHPA